MRTCKHCKHWERSRVLYPHAGVCDSDKFVDVSESTSEETPIDGVSFHDVEGWKSSFMTGENFGCVHFEPLEPV